MKKSTLDDLAALRATFAELAAVQRRADTLMLSVVDRRERGVQAAVCRMLGIKPQSLAKRLTAARSRVAEQATDPNDAVSGREQAGTA